MSEKEMRFGFGRNWAKFVESHFNDEALAASVAGLLSFLKLENLSNRTFLDIGCGSGLSSLSAYKAGAQKIFSFDYDINAVETTTRLKHWVGNPATWEVTQGSILDDAFVASLEPADVVYAWGVLHHTGDVWHALDNTRKLLKPDGLMFIALYEYGVPTHRPNSGWISSKNIIGLGGSENAVTNSGICGVLILIRFTQSPAIYPARFGLAGTEVWLIIMTWWIGWVDGLCNLSK